MPKWNPVTGEAIDPQELYGGEYDVSPSKSAEEAFEAAVKKGMFHGLTRGGGAKRTFETGASRDTETGKLDYEGFLSPLVLEAFATYMNFNREMADGSTRDSDNWQKGMPKDVYMKSGWRHFLNWWRCHRGLGAKEGVVWALCGLLFNLQGYLLELLKADPGLLERSLSVETGRREATRKPSTSAKSS